MIKKYNDLFKIRQPIKMDILLQSEYNGIIANIMALISDRYLTPTEMNVIVDDSNERMDLLNEHLPTDEFILISTEIVINIEEILDDALELEMFETCANIRDFYGRFYRV